MVVVSIAVVGSGVVVVAVFGVVGAVVNFSMGVFVVDVILTAVVLIVVVVISLVVVVVVVVVEEVLLFSVRLLFAAISMRSPSCSHFSSDASLAAVVVGKSVVPSSSFSKGPHS